MGSQNIATMNIREKFEQLLSSYGIDKMVQDLNDIENPKDRINCIAGIAEYIIPKLARTEMSGQVDVKTVSDITKYTIKAKS